MCAFFRHFILTRFSSLTSTNAAIAMPYCVCRWHTAQYFALIRTALCKKMALQAFVYDCGKVADQVLITIGQAFTLAQNQPKKVKHKKKRSTVNLKEGPAAAAAPGDPVVEERPHTVDLKTGTIKEVEVAFALPSIIETIAEEVEEQSKTADEIVNISNPEVAKMVTTKKGEVDDIGKELLAMMKAEVEVVIEAHEKAATLKKGAKMAPNKAASLKVSLAETANLTPAKLIARLNAAQSEKEDVSLRKATIRPQDRPTWVSVGPESARRDLDHRNLTVTAVGVHPDHPTIHIAVPSQCRIPSH